MQVLLDVPEEVYRRAEILARQSRRAVADVLSEQLLRTLSEEGQGSPTDLPALDALTDEEILALSESRMDPDHDRRLGLLLERQGEGTLTAPERYELSDLMQIYREGLLRKSRALREAVRRGLRENPAS